MQNKRKKLIKELSDSLCLRLSQSELPIHSFLMDWKGITIHEVYHPPYAKSDLHRMFSITKSLCSIAVGFLFADQKIILDDPIVHYFPEYCPDPIPPWLKEMTIRHMLVMETCHSSTTYKTNYEKNWVESFFMTPPSHRSGQIFLYDTSSSHTLAALIKKVTGQGILDYLREKCLNQIGFSKEAFILNDPFESEMGGSGLMALSSDLLKLGRFCMDTIQRGEGRFADYLRDAVSFQVPTLHFGQTLDEQQGYGYQFWRIRNGFAMYGMGGQYVLFYPEPNLVFIITADTQNIRGGNQKILDIIGSGIISLNPVYYEKPHHKRDCPLLPSLDAVYRIFKNQHGFQRLSLILNYPKGTLTLYSPEKHFTFPFSFDKALSGILQEYEEKIAVKAIWLDSDTLYLPVQIIGRHLGSIHIMLRLSEEHITVWMKKIEESCFTEFQGFLEGEKI